MGQIKIKSKALKYEKGVMQDDESENVTGIVYLYQLLIYLFNLEISTEMSFEKLTWNRTPYPTVHLLNCC